MAVVDGLDDLDALDLFVSAVELGSISQAAGRHQLSQPAVSMRLSRLERRLGLALLHRSPAGITPTEQGAAVVEWARELLDHAARIGAAVGALRRIGHGDGDVHLTIAASLTIAEQLVPRWLTNARRTAPQTHVAVTVANSTHVVELVRHGTVALGFVESDETLRGLRSRVVDHDELVVVVAPGHPWTRRRQPLEPHHLAGTPMVLREPGSGTRRTFEHALARTGHRPAPAVLELTSTAAIRNAVATGLGPTVISRLAVSDDVAARRLALVPTTGIDLRRSLRAAWRGPTPAILDILIAPATRSDLAT